MEEQLNRLVLRIFESVADRMLERTRLASGFEARQQYEFNALGFSRIKASLELRESRLRLLRADGAAVRLDIAVRAEFSFGLPYPDRRIDLSCAVLVKPELRRGTDRQLILSTDFASAVLRDVRVKRSSSGGMLGFDTSGLDPFADVRWSEMAKVALRAALRRLGTRQAEWKSWTLDRLLEAAADAGPLTIEVDDGEIRVGIAASAVSLLDAEQGSAEEEDARLQLSDAVLTRLFDDSMKTRTWGDWWRIEAPHVRCLGQEIEVAAEVLPRVAYWPASWRLRLRGRLRPVLEARGIELHLLDVGFQGPMLPSWLRQRILQALAARLAVRSWPRSFSFRVPRSEGEQWNLEISRIDIGEGCIDLVLTSDL